MPITEQLLAYLQAYVDGKISYRDFSTTLYILREIVEYTNADLDGTCAGGMAEEDIRALIGDIVRSFSKVATRA